MKRRGKWNNGRCRPKNTNPNLVWKGRFRLVTHRPTHTPQFCVSQHWRCFQAGWPRLCVKKARAEPAHCSGGPCLGQNSAPFAAHLGLIEAVRADPHFYRLLLPGCWPVLKSSFLPCRSRTSIGERHSGRSTPESPGAAARTGEDLDTLGFRLPNSSGTIPRWGIFKQAGDFQMTDASHRSLKRFCAS